MLKAGDEVAVTGATGFIGRYLVDALVGHGLSVVAVVRDLERAAPLARDGVRLAKADLSDRAALTEAFTGVAAVVSNAAVVSIGNHRREVLVATNVEGTENVMRAAAAAGVARVVQMSSAVVYRPKRGHHYHEDDPLRDRSDWGTRLSDYAVSKACAERAAWRLADELGLALTTLRPHTVFGAFDRHSFTRWLKRFMAPPVSLFPTRLYLPPIYAGDLAEAVALALRKTEAEGRAYNIAHEPDRHSYWDLMEAYRRAGGAVPRLVVPVPVPMRRRFSVDRAKEELGLSPRPLEAAFRDMLEREAQLPSSMSP
ncbi:MAG: NAD(P)-dependent oxidoreductase [Polyangiaceae bacterium]